MLDDAWTGVQADFDQGLNIFERTSAIPGGLFGGKDIQDIAKFH